MDFMTNYAIRIAKLAAKRKMLFMASVDLDRLKLINDHYGHIEGDFAIRSIAQARYPTLPLR